MKKLQWLIWGALFLLVFESCSKDKLEPNDSKKAATKQQQANPDQSQTQPQPVLPPSCPHSGAHTSQG